MSSGPRLLATSDLHVNRSENEDLVRELHPTHPDDWLIVAGDVGDRVDTVTWALGVLAERFARVIWVPGNHELWTTHDPPGQARGVERYERLVALCRREGVLTPEDPFAVWPGPGPSHLIAPAFLLYDYSFRPEHVSEAGALDWAAESNVMCADEAMLHPDPYPSRAAWCTRPVRPVHPSSGRASDSTGT